MLGKRSSLAPAPIENPFWVELTTAGATIQANVIMDHDSDGFLIGDIEDPVDPVTVIGAAIHCNDADRCYTGA